MPTRRPVKRTRRRHTSTRRFWKGRGGRRCRGRGGNGGGCDPARWFTKNYVRGSIKACRSNYSALLMVAAQDYSNARMRVMNDILSDVESSFSVEAAATTIWAARTNAGVFETLLQHKSTPELLARLLALARPTLPVAGTFLWHRTAEDDRNNDGHAYENHQAAVKIRESVFDVADANAPALHFTVLVIHFLRDRVPFQKALPALQICLERTPAGALTALLPRARVGIRHATLFAHCCSSIFANDDDDYHHMASSSSFLDDAANYAHLVLDNIPLRDRRAYVCVLDRATLDAQHYAQLYNMTSIVDRLRRELPGCRAPYAVASTTSVIPQSLRGRRNKQEEEVRGATTPENATNLIPGDPDEVQLRFVPEKLSKQREEVVSLSRASLRKIRDDPASVFVQCASLNADPGTRTTRNNMFDVTAMRHAPRFVPLTALGFLPYGATKNLAIGMEELAAWPVEEKEQDDEGHTTVVVTLAWRPGNTVTAMPLEHLQALPGDPFFRARDNISNPFVAFSPDEQRALTRYHHDWDRAINNMLLFGASTPQSEYFGRPEFVAKWRLFGPTRSAAARNVVDTQQRIDDAFRRAQPVLDDGTVVFHGTGAMAAAEHLFKEYLSTSVDMDTAVFFAEEEERPHLLRISLPRGLPVIYMEPFAVEHSGEHEVLLPRGIMLTRSTEPISTMRGPNGPVTVVPMTAALSREGWRILGQSPNEKPEESSPSSSFGDLGNDSFGPDVDARCAALQIVQSTVSAFPNKNTK